MFTLSFPLSPWSDEELDRGRAAILY